jgi:hypothetical protein
LACSRRQRTAQCRDRSRPVACTFLRRSAWFGPLPQVPDYHHSTNALILRRMYPYANTSYRPGRWWRVHWGPCHPLPLRVGTIRRPRSWGGSVTPCADHLVWCLHGGGPLSDLGQSPTIIWSSTRSSVAGSGVCQGVAASRCPGKRSNGNDESCAVALDC